MTSIIIPFYNPSIYFKACLESINAQTNPDYELIFVNDGSTDDSLSTLQNFNFSCRRIQIHTLPNGGVAKARNFGVSKASRDYLLFLDADTRQALIAHLKAQGIHSVFHYVPLHSSPAGLQFSQKPYQLPLTDDLSGRLLRLPCYYELEQKDILQVCKSIQDFLGK